MFNRTRFSLDRIKSDFKFAVPHAKQGSDPTLNVSGKASSSSSSSRQSSPMPISQLESKTYEKPVIKGTCLSRNVQKKLLSDLRILDTNNHCQIEEFSCGLCSIIVPDEETMIEHSESQMHFSNLLKCLMDSLKNSKEEIKKAEDYESDSSSSDFSDEDYISTKKQRVQWDLTDEVGTKSVDRLKMEGRGNSVPFQSQQLLHTVATDSDSSG